MIVTDEMIEAGFAAIEATPAGRQWTETLPAIYLAMSAAAPADVEGVRRILTQTLDDAINSSSGYRIRILSDGIRNALGASHVS